MFGVDDIFSFVDEGGGVWDYLFVFGYFVLVRYIGQLLFVDEFDLFFFQKKLIDYGLFLLLFMMIDCGCCWDNYIILL